MLVIQIGKHIWEKKLLSKEGTSIHNPKDFFRALNKLRPEIKRVGVNINQIARYVNYMDRNNMINQAVIAEYNSHFLEHIKLERELTNAIHAFLRELNK